MTVARPMPLAPPVTMATLPASRCHLAISPSDAMVLLRTPPGKPSVSQNAVALSGGRREMKFGLFYEISIPRPWTPEKERTVYNNCLEQVKLADELGFDHVWAVEHHFLEEYSHCSAPELFLDRLRRAHQEHPGRARHRGLRPRVQPSHQDRREHGHARHPVGRPPACRHRTVSDLDRARRLRRQSRHHQEELGRVRALPAQDVDAGDLLLSGRVLVDAGAHHPAQAVPEAAPADVGGRDQPRHRDRRRRPRAGQPRPLLRGLRGAGEEDQGVPPAHQDRASRSAPS